MLFILSLMITIILRGSSSSRNPFLDVFKSIVYFFIYVQLVSSFLLFIGFLSPVSSFFTLILPLIFLWKTTNKPLNFKPLLPFLPLGLFYLFFALPSPFLRDSLTYHLSLSKLYSATGSFTQTDEVIFGYFPQGWQAILALFQSVSSIEPSSLSPRLLGVLLSLGTGFGITGVLLEQRVSKIWSLMAGIMFLLIPTALEFGTSCYVQSWLVLLSFYTISSFLRGESAIKIGLLVGLLCSLKYSSLFWVLLFGLIYIYRRKPYFFLGVILTGFPFYLRNIWLKGNPIFPLGYSFFGGEGWDEWRSLAYSITLQNYGMGREISDYILLPFRIFFAQEMYDDFEGTLGLGLGLLLFLALISFRQLQKREYWLIYFGLGWAFLWAFQVQQIRFLMPAIPLFFLLSIPILSQRRPSLAPLFLLLSFLSSISPFQQFWKAQKPLYFYQQGKKAYLERQLPENYPVYQYLNAQETDKIWLVWMRGYHYYLDQPARIDSIIEGYRFENLLHEKGSPQEILASLKEDHISHIVINRRFFLVEGNADRLGEGVTEKLRESLFFLIQNGLLIQQKEFGNITIYSVSSSGYKDSK